MEALLQQARAIVRDIFRYRWMAFVIAWVICLVMWPVMLMLPNKYEAQARVFVDPSTALQPVIQGIAIQQDLNSQLGLVRQSLLSRPNLEKVMDEGGLAPEINVPYNRARVLDALSQRIDIVSVSPTGDTTVPSKVYTISYQDPDRDRALKVVKILLDSFMQETIGGKRRDSQTARQFLESQIKDYEGRLADAEQRLAEFKKKNVGMVPGDQQGDYFTRQQSEMDAVKQTQTKLDIALKRRSELALQLRGEAPAAAATGPISTAGAGTRGGDTLSRIQETQAKLDELLLRFTEKHPDVIALRQTLADLKDRRAKELEALKQGDANAAVATGASSNPVYQSIMLQLNQADVEIAGLRGELADHQSKVADLRKFVDTMPQVEAEYARLNRDYAVEKAQYNALVDRLEKARIGGDAEATGSVRFDIIDPPSADFKPVSPQRSLLLGVVLLLGLGGGAGVAYLMTLLRPVFHSARQLADLTGVAVLGVVSASRVVGNIVTKRGEYWRYSLACTTFLLALMLVLAVGRAYAPLSFQSFAFH